VNIYRLAWRNLIRSRKRSILTAAAVTVGAASIVLFGGYVAANIKGLQTITVRQVGHLQISARGYSDFGRSAPGDYAVDQPEKLVAALKADPVVGPLIRQTSSQVQLQGIAGNYEKGVSSPFLGLGVDPAERAAMLRWDGLHTGIPPGVSGLKSGDDAAGVIGVGLSQMLMLCDDLRIADCKRRQIQAPVDAAAPDPSLQALAASARPADAAGTQHPEIEVLTATANGAPNVLRLDLLKSERQPVKEIDAAYLAMPLRFAQRLIFGTTQGKVTGVVVQLQRTSDLEQAKRLLKARLADWPQPLEVTDFHELAPVYYQVDSMLRSFFNFIAGLMVTITFFSIVNTINIAINERVAEIGTLRALGFDRSFVLKMFMIEGSTLGLVGALIGAVAAALIAEYGINLVGWTWTPPGRSVAVPVSIDVFGSPWLVVGCVLALTLVACLSSLGPARRAARLEVVEALRHA